MGTATNKQAPTAPDSDDDGGRSLWSDAWKRLKRNKLAVISAFFILGVAIAGYTSPLLSEYATNFSVDEQHTALKTSPPGTRDISIDHPTFDDNKDAFAVADLDGDGFLSCRRDNYGELNCPELKTLQFIAENHFDFMFGSYDVAKGTNPPPKDRIRDQQPDNYISWPEFPKTDADLPKELRGYGLAGPDAFRDLDVNKDNVLSQWEITERARLLRYYSLGQTKGFDRFIADYDEDKDLRVSLAEYPGAPELHTFVLGTNENGKDVMTSLLYGARMSITVALLATFVSLLIGVIYGAVSGYYGGRVDNIMMRIVDIMYGLPFMFLVILLMTIVGKSMILLFIALGAVQWLGMARIVRGQVMSLKRMEFIEAARAIGASRMSIVFRHLIRNAVGPVVVFSTLMIPRVILEEAFLSFLGLGLDNSWGLMISEGRNHLETHPWLIIAPGVALALTLFAMNFLGDGVRDAIDPKQA
jgi:oligopeptide transport system permease protein